MVDTAADTAVVALAMVVEVEVVVDTAEEEEADMVVGEEDTAGAEDTVEILLVVGLEVHSCILSLRRAI